MKAAVRGLTVADLDRAAGSHNPPGTGATGGAGGGNSKIFRRKKGRPKTKGKGK